MRKSGQTRRQLQAQAQAQEETIISVTESFELVQCLLRVSVFHVAFLRGLFPDSYFKGTCMDNLEGMEIKMLRPECNDSKMLIDWVEEGVKDAIEQMYLKTLFFGIAVNPEGTRLLEEYIFSFDYDKNGGVSMKFMAKGKRSAAPTSQASVSSVRYQVIRLMRMLVQLCNTLDRVPDERYLFMKLAYNDSAPDDYEPPYFQAREEGEPPHFSRKPFSIQVGNIATNYHAVSLRLKSVLDGCPDARGDEPYPEPEASAVASGNTGCTTTDPTRRRTGTFPQGYAPTVIEEENAKAMSGGEGSTGPYQQQKSVDTDMTFDPAMEDVKRFCLEQQEVDLRMAASHFADISSDDLSRAFEQLVFDGVLKKTKINAYKVCQKPGIRGGSATKSQSGRTHVRQSQGQLAPFDPALRDVQGMDSQQGRASLFGESLESGQPSDSPSVRPSQETARQWRQQENVVLDSQESNELRAKRKASFVEQPIHQKRNCPTTRARSRLYSMSK